MSTSRSADVLKHLDEVIDEAGRIRMQSKHEDLSDLPHAAIHQVVSRLGNALMLFAPPASFYMKQVRDHQVGYGRQPGALFGPFVGLARSLRHEYAQGTIASYAELLHADVFGDFVEMARHLSQEGYKDAAAVIVGSTLEGHLRQLSAKHGLATVDDNGRALKADRLNAELAKVAYEKQDQKQVTAWLDLRNEAAHGHYAKYSKEQVDLMVDGIAAFMRRCPA